MEKYVVLFLLLVLAFALTVFSPVLGRTPDRTFLLCPASTPASLLPQDSPAWKTRGYTVFLLKNDELSLADRLPRSRTVKEYFLEKAHSLATESGLMQVCVCATHVRCGVPYLID